MNNSEQPKWSDAPKQLSNLLLPAEIPQIKETVLGKEEKNKGIKAQHIIDILKKGSYQGPLKTLDRTELHCTFNGRAFRIEEGPFSFELTFNRRTKHLKVTAINKIEGKRSNHIFPTKLFRFFITILLSEINGIEDSWYNDGTDNTVAFRNAYKAGKSKEEAAFMTGTGKIAKEFNFVDVTVDIEGDTYFVDFSKKQI